MVFTCIYCGLDPLVAQLKDSGSQRLDNIVELILASKYSIHDLSRMVSEEEGAFARFNMPFELGIEIGIRACNADKFDRKKCLVLDSGKYRYRRAISDLSGSDIASYGEHSAMQPENLVRALRDWFTRAINPKQRSSAKIWAEFNEFVYDLDLILEEVNGLEVSLSELTEAEFIYYAKEWVIARATEE